MITFHVEPWIEFKREAAILFPKHWKEIALHQAEIPLDVDFASFDQMDDMGMLHVVVAREAGTICGYWVGILKPHLHYRQSLTAYTDSFYVRQESRRDVYLFDHMLDFIEETLVKRGVQKYYIATKCHKDLSKIFERRSRNARRRKMTRTEIVYTTILRD